MSEHEIEQIERQHRIEVTSLAQDIVDLNEANLELQKEIEGIPDRLQNNYDDGWDECRKEMWASSRRGF